MASLLGMYGGGGRKRAAHAVGKGGGAAPVRGLLRSLRSSLRRSAARTRRPGAVRFGYDLHSYLQNFDDGLGASGHHRL
ncbi:hypothetical protein ACP70R_019233 [Stipagrostis hirtigluma subsp. patula]